jgi:protein disulfide-isomerase
MHLPLKPIALALGLVLAIPGCKQAPHAPSAAAPQQQIAWREGDVGDALAEAKESGKPVILYWGAAWCPPCNQMKSTLFKDPTFIAETKNFVPVYLDGDSKGAQQWGDRFGISGYPTVIVLRPDGSEITRLSSAATASKFAELLQLAAKRTDSIEQVLKRAEADPAQLSADDWQILAGFDWRNDPKHFEDEARAGALLERLAKAAPDPAQQRRFGLLALAVSADQDGHGKVKLTPTQQARLEQILPPMLASADETTANRQELMLDAARMIAGLPDAAEREALGRSLVAALDQVYADQSLSLTDRLDTTYADIVLAKADGGPIPPAVRDKVRQRVAWANDAADNPMSRQAVISDAADLLDEAGDREAAKTMLLAELKRSKQPYYYMLDLADLYEEDGDAKAAIDWAHKAYDAAEGPATRVQWAIAWSNAVMRLTPKDSTAVADSADAVIAELGKSPDSYYRRTRVKVASWGDKLRAWSEQNDGGKVLAALRRKMAGVCAKEGAKAAECREWSRVA